MPSKKRPVLTAAEVRIMEVLWKRRRATVAEVVQQLPGRAYNTILTTLRVLEKKGHVRHEETGRAFVYIPVSQPEEAAQTAVGDLLQRFFKDNPNELALRLMERNKPSPSEIARLRELIRKYEKR